MVRNSSFNAKNSSLKGSLSVGEPSKLTPREKEILAFLSDEDFPMSIKQLSIKQNVTVRAIQKIVKKLREKGYLTKANNLVRFSESTSELSHITTKHRIRLHGQEFNIKILEKDERYETIRNKANTIKIDGNTVRLYRDSIEIYGTKSFFADDPQKATSRSFEYWDRFFNRLEYEFKVILVKNRVNNISLVNSHYAEINNELGEECEKKGYKIKIFAKDDGKLWFLIDNSYNLREAEAIHPETAKQDMEQIKDYFNDIRDNEHLKPSEILRGISELSLNFKNQAELTKHEMTAVYESIKTLVEILKPKETQQEQTELKERPRYIN